jgi:predicted kinase
MTVLLVNGAPGSGKSTLAAALSAESAIPVISKDAIKEALADSLGFGSAERHHELTEAAFTVMWRLAREFDDAILDANFRPASKPLLRQLADEITIVEILCECPLPLCQARFAGRSGRHAVHPAKVLDLDLLASFSHPLGVGPVIRVDTSGPVRASEVVTELRRGGWWPSLGTAARRGDI